jgi:hypothetical protein
MSYTEEQILSRLDSHSRYIVGELWVIVLDGKVIKGASAKSFRTIGAARGSFSNMGYKTVRKKLEESGRLVFLNILENNIIKKLLEWKFQTST